jgi:hypothetical protein
MLSNGLYKFIQIIVSEAFSGLKRRGDHLVKAHSPDPFASFWICLVPPT